MLAYAAHSPRTAGRAGSPKALTLIVAGHAVLIAAVMTAKMDVIRVTPFDPIDVVNVDTPPPPPPPEPKPQADPRPTEQPVQDPVIDRVDPVIPMGQADNSEVEVGPIFQQFPPLGSGGTVIDPPKREIVKVAAVFRTPDSALRPPYPNDKLRLEEEATLRLRLNIDARGRVTAVEPVGQADPSFLEAARRHIIKAWRYKPATEDGVAVASSVVINLSFRLEEA